MGMWCNQYSSTEASIQIGVFVIHQTVVVVEKRNEDDRLHCENGPARIVHTTDGDGVVVQEHIEWFVDGRLHREGGPASERICCITGKNSQAWFIHDRNHRTDGPAVVSYLSDGRAFKMWFVKGKCIHSNEAFMQAANVTRGEMAAIVLKYGNVS